MATWLVKAEIEVEADNRRDAWAEARKILDPLNGWPISIPQQPVENMAKDSHWYRIQEDS